MRGAPRSRVLRAQEDKDGPRWRRGNVHNPFTEIIKADELSARRARSLFVPEASPIWSHIQNPLNHVIVGPRGAGKTIALRQLDHRGQNASSDELGFIGIYVQISRISTTFQSLFEEATERQDVEATRMFQRVFSDNVWMEILAEMARYLQTHTEGPLTIDARQIFQVTGIEAKTAEELEDQCIGQQAEIERRIQTWSVTSDYSWRPMRISRHP